MTKMSKERKITNKQPTIECYVARKLLKNKKPKYEGQSFAAYHNKTTHFFLLILHLHV